MKKHLNTLFVTLEGCWLSKDGDTVKVNAEGTCLLRVPLHNLPQPPLSGLVIRSYIIRNENIHDNSSFYLPMNGG